MGCFIGREMVGSGSAPLGRVSCSRIPVELAPFAMASGAVLRPAAIPTTAFSSTGFAVLSEPTSNDTPGLASKINASIRTISKAALNNPTRRPTDASSLPVKDAINATIPGVVALASVIFTSAFTLASWASSCPRRCSRASRRRASESCAVILARSLRALVASALAASSRAVLLAALARLVSASALVSLPHRFPLLLSGEPCESCGP